RRLSGLWEFHALDESACRVTLTLDFEPTVRMLAPALAVGFQGLADRMVDDFVRVADRGERCASRWCGHGHGGTSCASWSLPPARRSPTRCAPRDSRTTRKASRPRYSGSRPRRTPRCRTGTAWSCCGRCWSTPRRPGGAGPAGACAEVARRRVPARGLLAVAGEV